MLFPPCVDLCPTDQVLTISVVETMWLCECITMSNILGFRNMRCVVWAAREGEDETRSPRSLPPSLCRDHVSSQRRLSASINHTPRPGGAWPHT